MRGKTATDSFIKFSELRKGVENMLHGSSVSMVEGNYRFTRGIRDYTIGSMGANVMHIGQVFEKYIELEGLKYTSNYVKFPRNDHNAHELKNLIEVI